MESLVKCERLLNEEIKHFVGDANSYYCVTEKGRIIIIIKSQSYQPAIVDESDFITFMILESTDGFFLLTQRFLNFAPEPWILKKEMIPICSEGFFLNFCDKCNALLDDCEFLSKLIREENLITDALPDDG